MIETRFALPVRSPTPFIVPWTWRAPASTPRQRVGHAALDVVVAVDADAHVERRRRRAAVAARDLRRAATSRSCRTGRRVSAPALGRRAQAVAARSRVVAPAVEEVLGVVDHALARRDEEGDRVGDHREVLLARRRARPSRGAAPRSCRRACRPARSSRPASAAPGRRRRRRRAGASSRRRRPGRARGARAASSSKSSSSLGFEAGKPASIRWTPSSSSARTTRTFSPAVSDMPSPCMPSRRVAS